MHMKVKLECLKVIEEGQKSERKHDHLALGLRKLYGELIAMDDGSDNIGNDSGFTRLGSTERIGGDSQVFFLYPI